MKRVALTLAGVVLLGLLPFSVAGCNVTCACAAAPDPNWTPPPITSDQAAIYAAKVAGVPAMSASLSGELSGRQLYLATATSAVAIVDGESGTVLMVALLDRMPGDDAVSAATGDARTAAEAFLQQAGYPGEGPADSVQVTRHGGVAAYQLDWKDARTAAPRFRLFVNASTGAVFAYLDLRTQLAVTAPIVGRARATSLAIAAFGVPGEIVTSADLAIEFAADGAQGSEWTIGLGVPTATQADVYEHGALLQVDAVTGEATVIKS
jgi:hypothetical protein